MDPPSVISISVKLTPTFYDTGIKIPSPAGVPHSPVLACTLDFDEHVHTPRSVAENADTNWNWTIFYLWGRPLCPPT